MTIIDCINLPVYTKAGDHLGRVVGVEIEAISQQIQQYKVVGGLIPSLNKKTFLISIRQVLEINKDKMIVEDLVFKNGVDLKYSELVTN